jgi:hypothetical protein
MHRTKLKGEGLLVVRNSVALLKLQLLLAVDGEKGFSDELLGWCG